MKKSVILFFVFVTVAGIAFFGCGQAREAKEMMRSEEKAKADSITSVISSSAAVENTKDSARKFVRTAELKFRVKDVTKTTYRIEDITVKNEGFVSFTKLYTNIDWRNSIPVSKDSLLETIFFTVENDMTLRVPNTKLDTTLKEITRLIDFLDYRIIKADDVSLLLLSNKLTQERMKKPETQRTTVIESRDKKVLETRQSEENLLSKQEMADEAKLSNLSLTDKIKFSTINLHLYQKQNIRRELAENTKNIQPYEPAFYLKFIDSIKTGWDILEEIILALSKIWSLLALIAVGYYLLVKYFYKPKK